METKTTYVPFLFFLVIFSLIISSNSAQKALAYSQDLAPNSKISSNEEFNNQQTSQSFITADIAAPDTSNNYPVHPGFPINLDYWLEKTPVTIADINGDGSNEMLLPTLSGKFFVWNASGFKLPGFPINTGGQMLGRVALGDLDHDGKLEIAAGVSSNSNGVGAKVYIWRSDGTLFPGWPQNTACNDLSLICDVNSIVLADLDGDGNLEIIATTNNGVGWSPDPNQSFPDLYAWHSNGQLFAGNWPMADEADARIGGSMAVGDLTGDGSAEVVLGRDYNRLFAYDKNGYNLPGWPHYTWWPYDRNNWNDDQIEFARSAVTLADLNGDGTLEYIVNGLRRYANSGTYYNTDLLVYTPEGVRLHNWETPASGTGVLSQNTWSMLEAPAVADINNDGRPDILVSTQDGWVRAYTAEKKLLWAFDYTQGQKVYATETVIGDVNGDGWNEILFGSYDVDFGSPGPFGVWILDHNGIPITGANPLVVNSAYGVSGSPVLADLDGDGNLEIVADTYNGLVYVWDAPGRALPAQLPWPMARHDLQRTGLSFSSTLIVDGMKVFLPVLRR